MNQPSHLLVKPTTASSSSSLTSRSTTPVSIASLSGTSSREKQEFKYFEFALSLLTKFCHNYDACRSEFGRVGGLSTCMSRIHEDNSDEESTTYNETMIEILCMSCKTASNRIRLRDSGHLSTLVKLQQKLRTTKPNTLPIPVPASTSTSSPNPIDSTIYNKLLAALCCFVHDHDSMQILYAQGLIDSLLFYLDESVSKNEVDKAEQESKAGTSSANMIIEKKLENATTQIESKKVSLRKLIFTEENLGCSDFK